MSKRRKIPFKKSVLVYCIDGDVEKKYLYALFKDRYKDTGLESFPKIKNQIEMVFKSILKDLELPETRDLVGVFILIDMDTIIRDNKSSSYKSFKRKVDNLQMDNVHIIESRPCIEYWFLLHYCFTDRLFDNCEQVMRELKRNGRLPDYDKSRTYSETVYNKTKLHIDKAMKNSKKGCEKQRQPQEKYSYTKMYQLIEYLDNKCNSQ